MNTPQDYVLSLKQQLLQVSSVEKAQASKRYFSHSVMLLGANAADIKDIIKQFHASYSDLSAEEVLAITEALLQQAQYSEETMLAFGLIIKHVKKHYDDSLMSRFEYWLEHYATNWSLVDDLCMKAIFNFLMARPHLIVQTQKWAYSDVSWCRRASNVAWVKFISRRIGQDTYYLDKTLIFKHCDLMLTDHDEFVQKSIGWLLKVTAVHHQQEVLDYIRGNHTQMWRSTIRYGLEKVSKSERDKILKECR